eukprot:comp18701_c0_seq1/m.20425 comp18701_c0_seq1/g.20425  ORF comp18701_c0_seq1/g.20425 comp18701_c0_seq1/m.20425 type:complete len:498 (-) comp18701_c0_seq1:410-1903(-)
MAATALSKPTVVLGAGISGLAAAWELARRDPHRKIMVLEASGRAGGWVETTRKDGFLFEQGPHSIRSAPAGYSLCDMAVQLGLSDQVILPSKEVGSMNRYVMLRGKLHKLPNGLDDIIKKQGVFGRGLAMTGLRELLVPRRTDKGDESIHSFALRRFGPEVADVLFDAMTHGIYSGNCRELSVRACFPMLPSYEQAAGSVVRGMMTGKGKLPQEDKISDFGPETQKLIAKVANSQAWTFKNGVGTLAATLEHVLQHMPNVELCRKSPCVGVRVLDGGVEVGIEGRPLFEADHVISSIPAPELAKLLADSHTGTDRTVWSNTVSILSSIPFGSVAVVNLGFNLKVLPMKGFGYLIPSSEKDNALGVIFDSSVFPEQNEPGQDRLTVMMGGHRMQSVFGHSHPDKETMVSTALDALHRHMGISKKPDAVTARVQHNCIPQYQIGHVERMQELKNNLTHLYGGRLSVIGCSYLGVSLNDCVRIGRRVARAVAENKVDTGL